MLSPSGHGARTFVRRRSGSLRAIRRAAGRSRALILRSVFGYPSFRGQQAEIIAHVIAGGDALVLMPTGGGKSLCFQIPALVRPAVASRLGQSSHL